MENPVLQLFSVVVTKPIKLMLADSICWIEFGNLLGQSILSKGSFILPTAKSVLFHKTTVMVLLSNSILDKCS